MFGRHKRPISFTLKAHTKSVTAISWRSDSNVVSSASEDGSIRLWEMNEGKQVKNWTGHGGGVLDMTFTGDGQNRKLWPR